MVLAFRRVDGDILVLHEIFLILIFYNVFEHTAILHVMPIDYIMPAGKIRFALIIKINAPATLFLPSKSVFK